MTVQNTVQVVDVKKQGYISEVVTGMYRRKDATAFIRDVMDAAKADGYSTKEIRALAKLAIERNKDQVQAEAEVLFEEYDKLQLDKI